MGTRKIIVFDYGFMGDCLITSPLYKALSDGGFRVDVAALPEAREVLEANRYVSDIFTGRTFTEKVKSVRGKSYDVAMNVSTSLKTNLVMRFVRAKEYLGYSYGLKGLPLSHRIRISQRTGTVGNRTNEILHLAYLGLGIDSDSEDLIFRVRQREKPVAKWIGLHVNPRHDTVRRWPYFGKLAQVLRRMGYRVFYIGTASDKDYIKSLDGDADIANTPTVQSLASFLTRLGGFICVNSFPMHLARALGVTTLALISGTPASVIVKESENFRVLEAKDLSQVNVEHVLATLASD